MAASTTLLTDANSLANGTPTAQSTKNATNPSFAGNSINGNIPGPSLLDLQGELRECQVVIKEYKNRLIRLANVLDPGDPLYTTVNNDLASLV